MCARLNSRAIPSTATPAYASYNGNSTYASSGPFLNGAPDSGPVEAVAIQPRPTPSNQPQLYQQRSTEPVITTFRWPAALGSPDAVSITGSFSGWKDFLVLRRSEETGDFVRTIRLKPGAYTYKFLVDGQWATCPCDEVVQSEDGSVNNHRLVQQTVTFTWPATWGGNEVFLAADFVAWVELLPMTRTPSGEWQLRVALQPGTYSYQFLVDGEWCTDVTAPMVLNEQGWECNQLIQRAAPSFSVFYATGWQHPVLMAAYLGHNGEPGEWSEMPMYRCRSRSSPSGGAWWKAAVPLPPTPAWGGVAGQDAAPIPQLGFYVQARRGGRGESSSHSSETDKPWSGGYYTCASPGGYKLQQGVLKPFAQAVQAPVLVVTDLDGTMIESGRDADARTQAFTDYWESTGALNGSHLVFNTGRSIGQITSLLAEKAGVLALPEVLITAVGTKIFMLEEGDSTGRATCVTPAWREDTNWAALLDRDWDLQAVLRVGGDAVHRANGEAHWLDRGTEHPHRIALSVNTRVLHDLLRRIEEGLRREGVRSRIIQSGTGDWRYVDVVSYQAGKLEALEYVRTMFGVAADRTVACGDSGNDTLMLGGRNKAIVVGNAQPALVEWLTQQPQDDRIVYTDAPMASGILEGLGRLGLY